VGKEKRGLFPHFGEQLVEVVGHGAAITGLDALAVCQFKIRGVWHRGEIPERIRKIFGKIGIDSLK
jgi:hypothetical protein